MHLLFKVHITRHLEGNPCVVQSIHESDEIIALGRVNNNEWGGRTYKIKHGKIPEILSSSLYIAGIYGNYSVARIQYLVNGLAAMYENIYLNNDTTI